ncbi:MAG: DUF4136 domain-containing protein [Opitutaceae bacterium]
MKKLLISSILGTIALGFTACTTSPKIQYDSVQGYDFSKVKTYAVIDTSKKTNVKVGPGAVQAASEGLKSALESKGLTEGSAADADVLVVMYLQMTEKTDVTDFGYTYGGYRGYGYGYGGAYMGGGVTTTNYNATTLTIDIVDNVEDTLVWRGWASKDIYGDTKGTVTEEDRTRIKGVIANIMANYPPPPTPEK